MTRLLRHWVLFLLVMVVFIVQAALPSRAEVMDSCAGLSGFTPYINPPADINAGKKYGIEITQQPSVKVTPSASNPNFVTIQTVMGWMTYQSPTPCLVYNYPPPLQWAIYWGYFTFSSAFQGTLDLSGLPAGSYTGSMYSARIDLSKVPSGQCSLPVKYNGAVSDTEVAFRSGCSVGGGGTPAQPAFVTKPNQPEQTGSGPGLTPTPSCSTNGKVGDPCDVYNGNYYHEETDLLVRGLPAIRLERAYYSGKSGFTGAFGVGSHLAGYNYRITVPKDANGKVIVAPDSQVQFNTGNDSEIKFTNPGGGLVFTNNALSGTTGDTLTLTLDGDGKLSGAEYRNLEEERLFFNAEGWLTASQDASGNRLEFSRDSQGKLLRITQVATGHGIDLTYNSDGLISQATDSAGRTVSYAYSPDKELLTVTDPAGQSMHYTWDAQHRIISKTDFNGQTMMTNEYDAKGMVVKQTQADGQDILIAMISDTLRKVTDPNGGITTYTFNGQGLPIEVENALGHKHKTRYAPNLFTDNTADRFVELEDGLARTTHVDLNARNLPTRIIDPANRQASIVYDAAHPEKPRSITNPKGQVTQFEYDAAGRTTKITDNAGNSTTLTYNAHGQVLTATNALGHVTRFAYTAANELASVTDPLGNKSQFEYDALSRPVRVIDPKGNKTTIVYDVLDRPVSVTDALGNKRLFSYDANGNKVSETDPKGHTTTFVYDAKNRLVSTTNAKGETYGYQYDGADNLVSVTDPKGQVTTQEPDAVNRIAKITFGDNTTYTYTYDAADQLLSVSDGATSHGFTYDLLGRVTTAITQQGAVNYTYNANGNVTQLSSPSYGNVSYAYDELDRLSGITKDGKTYGYSYDPLGRRTALDRPNGVTTSYEYDAGSRLTALTHNKGTTVLERHNYQYDANGNIVKYVRSKGTSQPVVSKPCGKNGKGRTRQVMGYIGDKAETLERSYRYDALNRLTGVDALGIVASASNFRSPGNKLAAAMLIEQARRVSNPQMRNPFLRNAERLGAVLPESASWSFDENGNIAKKVLKTTDGERQLTYSYDEADRLVSLTRPLEEANGNRPCPYHWRHHGRGGMGAPAGKTETVTLDYDANGNLTGDSTGRTFTWNAQDQLVRLQTPGTTATFAYDPLGRRASFSRGNQSRSYFYDGLNALTDGSSRFLHGAGIDEPLQVDSANGSETVLQDHLGSTSQLLDAGNGSSKNRYDYKSYGKLEGDIDNRSLTNPYTYTGREDDGTGLMYYRARYYDPELEIFISQDPLGDAQRYVGGNPLKYIDPMGTIDVLFKFGGLASPHAAVLTEPYSNPPFVGANNQRGVYESIPGDPFTGRGTTYSGVLSDRALAIGQHGYIVELDQRLNQFMYPNTVKPPVWIGIGQNCSTYAGDQINYGLKQIGLKPLSPIEMASPAMLFNSLQQRGLVRRVTEYQGSFKAPVGTYNY